MFKHDDDDFALARARLSLPTLGVACGRGDEVGCLYELDERTCGFARLTPCYHYIHLLCGAAAESEPDNRQRFFFLVEADDP